MKYKVIIELDKERKTCLSCPFLDSNDDCKLQPDLEFNDSWDSMLSSCPLIESEGE